MPLATKLFTFLASNDSIVWIATKNSLHHIADATFRLINTQLYYYVLSKFLRIMTVFYAHFCCAILAEQILQCTKNPVADDTHFVDSIPFNLKHINFIVGSLLFCAFCPQSNQWSNGTKEILFSIFFDYHFPYFIVVDYEIGYCRWGVVHPMPFISINLFLLSGCLCMKPTKKTKQNSIANHKTAHQITRS